MKKCNVKNSKKKINTLSEIDLEIKSLNIKGIGTNNKQDEELYTVLKVLQTDYKALGITFPFNVEVSDKPDIILDTNNCKIGIEITFALNEACQKARKTRDEKYPKSIIEPSLYNVRKDRGYIEETIEKSNRVLVELRKLKWSSTIIELTLRDFQYQYNEFCKIANKQLFGSAYVDDELEKDVANLVLKSIQGKIKKSQAYKSFSKNYLIIYNEELLVDSKTVVDRVTKELSLLEIIQFDNIILRIQDKNYILF